MIPSGFELLGADARFGFAKTATAVIGTMDLDSAIHGKLITHEPDCLLYSNDNACAKPPAT